MTVCVDSHFLLQRLVRQISAAAEANTARLRDHIATFDMIESHRMGNLPRKALLQWMLVRSVPSELKCELKRQDDSTPRPRPRRGTCLKSRFADRAQALDHDAALSALREMIKMVWDAQGIALAAARENDSGSCSRSPRADAASSTTTLTTGDGTGDDSLSSTHSAASGVRRVEGALLKRVRDICTTFVNDADALLVAEEGALVALLESKRGDLAALRSYFLVRPHPPECLALPAPADCTPWPPAAASASAHPADDMPLSSLSCGDELR